MKSMKRIIESILTAGLLVLGVGMVQKAQAAITDTITVSVTPGNVGYGVMITSPETGGYDFATVNIGDVSISTVGITVKNTGTLPEYFGMAVSNLGSQAWTPVATNPPGTDHFRLAAWFSAGVPTSTSTFVDSSALSASPNGTSAGLFNQALTLPNTNAANPLWLNLSMPTALTTSISGPQTMTLSINGQAN